MKCRVLLSFLLVLFATQLASGEASYGGTYSVPDVPNVQVMDSTRFVTDPEGYVTEEERTVLDNQLAALRHDYGIEAVIVLLPSLDQEIEDFALELFRNWGLGSAKQNSGLLLLASMNDHCFRIQTGYGLEGVLPDAVCSDIIANEIAPYFQQEAYGEGLLNAIKVIRKSVDAGEYTPSDRRSASDDGETSSVIGMFLLLSLYLIAVIGFTMGAFVGVQRVAAQYEPQFALKKMDEHARKMSIWLIICIPVLIVFLIWYPKYRKRIQKAALTCPQCGSYNTYHLSGIDSSRLLSPAQRFETAIGSRKYAPYRCSQCGYEHAVLVEQPKTKYKDCPSCHTRSYYILSKKHVRTRKGRMLRTTWKCDFCDHTEYKDIRDDDDVNGGIIAGSIIGSSFGRSGGFGGGFGGSFGGGSTGGGGATGGW